MTTASNAYGGSATQYRGEGTTATSAYGGSAAHAEGGGTVATSAYGGAAYGDAHYYGGAYGAAYHPPVATVPYYGAYHPPVVVNSYGSGCYGYGGWAAAGAADVQAPSSGQRSRPPAKVLLQRTPKAMAQRRYGASVPGLRRTEYMLQAATNTAAANSNATADVRY